MGHFVSEGAIPNTERGHLLKTAEQTDIMAARKFGFAVLGLGSMGEELSFNNNNDNNNNSRIQRRYSRFFTISSQRHELSPTRTLKWPGCNHVQITCNTLNAYHVQVSCAT